MPQSTSYGHAVLRWLHGAHSSATWPAALHFARILAILALRASAGAAVDLEYDRVLALCVLRLGPPPPACFLFNLLFAVRPFNSHFGRLHGL